MKLDDQQASGNVEDRRGIGMRRRAGRRRHRDRGRRLLSRLRPGRGDERGRAGDAPARDAGSSQGCARGRDRTVRRQGPGQHRSVWGTKFQQSGSQYRPPTLVLFDGQVRSACGMGQAAIGPFYCPGRREALHRSRVLPRPARRAFGAPGDFAQAYVIAHEVGHHVQNLTRHLRRRCEGARDAARGGSQPTSVRMELQADCYAGVWAHHAGTMNQSRAGDIAEALNAATGHRRRPPAAAVPGPRRARFVHARHVGAARALVQARHGLGPAEGLQYLLDQRALRVDCDLPPIAPACSASRA